LSKVSGCHGLVFDVAGPQGRRVLSPEATHLHRPENVAWLVRDGLSLCWNVRCGGTSKGRCRDAPYVTRCECCVDGVARTTRSSGSHSDRKTCENVAIALTRPRKLATCPPAFGVRAWHPSVIDRKTSHDWCVTGGTNQGAASVVVCRNDACRDTPYGAGIPSRLEPQAFRHLGSCSDRKTCENVAIALTRPRGLATCPPAFGVRAWHP